MKRRNPLPMLAALAATLAFVVSAQVPIRNSGTGFSFTFSWPSGSTLTYLVNNQVGPGMPNLQPGSNPVAAIDAAWQRTASAAGLTAVNGGTTAVTDAGPDGTNIVSFAATPANQALLNGALSATVVYWNVVSPTSVVLTDFDTIVSSSASISTLGSAARFDIESVMTHEAGHAIGMDHSPIFSASEFAFHFTGSIRGRTHSQDDLSGIRAHYGLPVPGVGTVNGNVVRGGLLPVSGAHVFLVDAITGRVGVGALTDPLGAFLIPSVPRGLYNLYVEPLDGPATGANLIGLHWLAAPPDATFRSVILGGIQNPTALTVRPGANTSAGTITVAGPPSTLNVSQVFFNSSPTPTGSVSTLEQTAPYAASMGVFGANVNNVPDSGFSVSGPFVTITGPSTWTGSNPTFSDKIFPVGVPAGSPRGAYVLRMNSPAIADLAFFPGCLEIVPGGPAEAWTAPYGVAGVAGTSGPATLAANGPPALGNSGFALNLSGFAPGGTALLAIATAPDLVPLGAGATLAIDLFTSLLPLTALTYPVPAGVLTLPIPIPNQPQLAGVEVFLQAGATDPAAPLGYVLTNGLAVHIG